MAKKFIHRSIIKAVVFTSILSFVSSIYSQKYNAIWVLGYGLDSTRVPRFGVTELNFMDGNLKMKYIGEKNLPRMGFTNSSISDKSGILKYFTDGFRLFDNKEEIIYNGDSLNFGAIWKDYYPDLFYPTSNNHYFLPYPGNENNSTILLHFTPDYNYNHDFSKRYSYVPTFKMTRIDFDSLAQTSKVIYKDSIVVKGDFNEFHMSCTKQANGRDWWIIIEDYLTNNHKIFMLDPSGIRLFRNQKIGMAGDEYMWTGNSLFSPDGKLFIKYLTAYHIQLFDFDRCSGLLSNPRFIETNYLTRNDFYHLAISPNNRFLYLCNERLIWQYDLFSGNIKNSETVIGVWDGYLFKDKFPTSFFQMSLAADGKIYISCRSGTIYMHVIHKPNEKGSSCQFQLRGIVLPAYMFGSPPIQPNYNLGPVDGSPCDTLGMDNIPVADFSYAQDSFNSYKFSFRDLSYHEPNEWHWNFGDAESKNPESANSSTVHEFSKVGVYNVCLKVRNVNGESTLCKEIQIGNSNGIDSSSKEIEVSIFPNIVKEEFSLVFKNYLPQDAYLTLTDNLGKLVIKSRVKIGNNIFNISHLNSGVYYFSCFDTNNKLGSGKLIKVD
jgi:hypothetical protein